MLQIENRIKKLNFNLTMLINTYNNLKIFEKIIKKLLNYKQFFPIIKQFFIIKIKIISKLKILNLMLLNLIKKFKIISISLIVIDDSLERFSINLENFI